MRAVRLRRLRRTGLVRDLLSETELRAEDLIMPYFVIEGKRIREPIVSMPGIERVSIDNLIEDAKKAKELGIKAILLFGVSRRKSEQGANSYSDTGIVQKAVRAIRNVMKDIVIVTDVCLCGYTSHGHCGIVKNTEYGIIDDDKTLKVLAKIAMSHAKAGADFVAPSAMMDGQVGAIREALDGNGFEDVGILAYSAKYASNFYGPFREALDSRPRFGDRKSYQMDFRNSDEAMREMAEDMDEGADIIMVKPALAYLDIIRRARDRFDIPIAAYNVSGEYAMIKAYSKASSVERDLVLEVLTSIKRAGADLIITYHAKEAAKWLR